MALTPDILVASVFSEGGLNSSSLGFNGQSNYLVQSVLQKKKSAATILD